MYPEGYDASVWGPSGNITVNGSLTYSDEALFTLSRRELDDGHEIDLNSPPYPIHNGVCLRNSLNI